MIGTIQKIEDGKVYIQVDNGQLYILPIDCIDYIDPHVEDQVFLIRQEDQWKAIRRKDNKKSKKHVVLISCTIAIAAFLAVMIIILGYGDNHIERHGDSNNNISKAISVDSKTLSTKGEKQATSDANIVHNAFVGQSVMLQTDKGKLQVTLDGARWSDWGDSNWPEKLPEGTGILLIEMTLKDDGWKDEDNPDTFTYASSGFSVLDDEGVVLSESEYFDDDGLYSRDPNMKEGQTVRAFVPLFAKTSTKQVTLMLPNGVKIETDIQGATDSGSGDEPGQDFTGSTINITRENPNPIMYKDDELEITASHFTTDNTGLDMYHFYFNVTNNTGSDINLYISSFTIDDKSYDSIWGSSPSHPGKSVADLGAGSPSEVHQWGLDNFDKIKFTLLIDGYAGHDMLTVNGTVSRDMFQ